MGQYSFSYDGIIRIRFRGFDLSPCIEAPLLFDWGKSNKFSANCNWRNEISAKYYFEVPAIKFSISYFTIVL